MLARLLRLGLTLGLLVDIAVGLPGVVLASDERALELVIVVTVLETRAEGVIEAEVLTLAVQGVVGKSGYKKIGTS